MTKIRIKIYSNPFSTEVRSNAGRVTRSWDTVIGALKNQGNAVHLADGIFKTTPVLKKHGIQACERCGYLQPVGIVACKNCGEL